MTTINLKPMNEDAVVIPCDMNETIENIILRYEDKTGRHVRWRVIYNGKQLEKYKTLMDYNISRVELI